MPTAGTQSGTTSATPGAATILTFTAGSPDCRDAADKNATVTLQWMSRNASEAWVARYPTASDAGDPRTNPNAVGPLPPSGSLTLSFNCSDAANPSEFTLGVYGSRTSQLQNLLVQRNF